MLFMSACDATIVKDHRNDKTITLIHFHERITFYPDDTTKSTRILMAVYTYQIKSNH